MAEPDERTAARAEPATDASEPVQGSLFEEDYLLRTLGALGTTPSIALAELVANAWDAGASEVSIVDPQGIVRRAQLGFAAEAAEEWVTRTIAEVEAIATARE
jgi:hypothetical protein